MTTTVREITCPECERRWPTIAEQGIVTELHGKCYMCFAAEVAAQRVSRQESADYVVQDCGHCGGLPGKVEKCTSCFAKGWETVDKGTEALPAIRTQYKH